jgi:hypothetical protein
MSLAALGIHQSNAPIGPAELGGEDLLPTLPPAPPVGQILLGETGVGSGGSYRPHPALPPADHLDYFDKLVRAAVVVVLLAYLIRDPGRMFRALERRAGVK